mmetsp:Transcript_1667/g.3579  ORF Transcript_1667/g.3579 Transcript_1667/m.3579 type:complete len:139 (-) Transcript_1667:56-472(-)
MPPLPHACFHVTLTSAEETLYAISGVSNLAENSHLIQILSLSSMLWEVLSVKLPSHQNYAVVFKKDDSELFIAVNKSLYSFDCYTNSLVQLTNLGVSVQGAGGAGIFTNGCLLYYSNSSLMKLTIEDPKRGRSRCILQ